MLIEKLKRWETLDVRIGDSDDENWKSRRDFFQGLRHVAEGKTKGRREAVARVRFSAHTDFLASARRRARALFHRGTGSRRRRPWRGIFARNFSRSRWLSSSAGWKLSWKMSREIARQFSAAWNPIPRKYISQRVNLTRHRQMEGKNQRRLNHSQQCQWQISFPCSSVNRICRERDSSLLHNKNSSFQRTSYVQWVQNLRSIFTISL